MRRALVLVVLVGLAHTAAAQVPHVINFQGRLADSAGTPRTGVFTMTFAIYDAATAGTACHTEVINNVPVNSGLFSVNIGAGTPIPCTFGQPRWLAIMVSPDVTYMNTRIPLVSMAYSFVAERLAVPTAPRTAYLLGNGQFNIPLNNGVVNVNLNADTVGGKHITDFFTIPIYTCSGVSGLFTQRSGDTMCGGAAATLVGWLSP